MTAIDTPLGQANQAAFRRGLLSGIAASALLAATMTVAAFASGLIELPQVTVPTGPAPAVETYRDFGHRHDGPAVIVPPVQAPPGVAPGTNPGPGTVIDQYNPWEKGPAKLY